MTDPYQTLGLPAGTNLREVEKAYQRLKELYAEDSLATYALLTDEQRQQRLEQIETAFRSIIARQAPDLPESSPQAREATRLGPAPEADLSPGAYLRWLRESGGLSLRELADRTKIGASKLDAIEQQRFDLLPPPVYLRGFVFEYARCLGHADPRHLAEVFLRLHPEYGREL